MSAPAQPAKLLGIPLGEFGFFSALLLSMASGFLTFFATCFLAIVALLFWNTLSHSPINYADSYRYIAAPAGVAVLGVALLFFIGTWLRRKVAGGR
ncbi:MAG TPA: hypothetical protein VKT75_09640 [Acidobacteriaceae bacterium]|nr:hypothetical protein [Acidobacteriaceae bacterium]